MTGAGRVDEALLKGAGGPKWMVRALRSRNYRLYFGGQGLSLIGTWMQRIAMSWLVYRLTGSTLLLGVVGFASQIPTFILAPFAGVLADRADRRKVIIVTQTLAMLQALALAVLVLTGAVAVWQIIFLGILLGVVNAFDMPARQSFVVEMVENKEDLGNAIALNSSIVNGARLIGPSIAGVLVAAFGEGICFLVNGLSYLAVILALLAMRITRQEVRPQGPRGWRGMREGFFYAFSFAPIRAVLLLLALASLMGMPYTVLMPVFAKDILHGGPSTLGFLMGATGVGALAGGLYLASRRTVLGLGRFIPFATGIFGLGLVAFSFSQLLWLSLLLLLLIGFGLTAQAASSNTVLQTIVDEDKRGRVMSFYTMAFMGMVPFGSLLAGGLASLIGTPRTVMVGGLVCLLNALLFIQRISAYLRTETAPQKVYEIWRGR